MDILNPMLNVSKIRTIFISGLTYERLIRSRSSFQLSLIFFKAPYLTKSVNTAFVIIPEYKFFVSKRVMHKGYFVGISSSFIARSKRLIELNNDFYANQKLLTIGFINGYKYIFRDLAVEFIFGLGYASKINSNPAATLYIPIKQPNLRIGLNIGYRF